MKKILAPFFSVLFCGACIFAQAEKNTININGTDYAVDTLIHKHNVGPGTKYAYYDLPECPLKIHVMEIDLTNPYVEIETCLSGDSAVATERPSSMYARNDFPGHDMIGATNGDFYQYVDPIEIGIPRSGQFRRNECVTNPVGRASFVLTPDRIPYIDRVDFRGTLSKGDASTRIHAVNMQRLEWENTGGDFLLLYTNSYGKYTHKTTGGTKVIVRPKEGDLFFSANKNIECVVESVFDNPGVSPIPENAAVLYGIGNSETFLKGLAAGDNVTIFLKTDLRSQPGLLTDFKEQMGGSDDIVLQNGLTDDGQSGAATGAHPRTGIGISKDKKTVYFSVIDGRQAGSAGVSLQDLGSVFKALGAWDAVNLDGGGSSCMVVNNSIVNNPSDGKERPVGNGMLIYSNAPADEDIAILEFGPRPYEVPITAVFRPIIYAFNQYGVLKSKDLKEVKLTCSPEIGTIDENNVFHAATTEGEGEITATYGNLSVTQKVNLIRTNVALVHDKFLIDNKKACPIKLTATVGITTDTVAATTIDWVVADNSICEVRDGVVYGKANGQTTITGNSEYFNGELAITVEIPEADVMPVFREFGTAEDWTFRQVGGTDLTVSQLGDGFKLNYVGNGSSRGAYISVDRRVDVWSLPEGLRISVNPGDVSMKKVSVTAMNALGELASSWAFTETELPKNQVSTFNLSFKDIWDVDDVAIYPITLTTLRFDLGASAKGTPFEIQIPAYSALYTDPSGVNEVTNSGSVKLFPNPAAAGTPVQFGMTADVEVYNLNGALVSSQKAVEAIATESLSAGIYVAKVRTEGNVYTGKLIIK